MTSMVFRVCENPPELLREVFVERGWKEYEEGWDADWNIWWKSCGFRASDFDRCQPWQRLNHFPKSGLITRKDSLARNLRRMRGVYGSSIYNFSPLSFILPNDYKKFVGEYSNQADSDNDQKIFWICKPVDLSRGRGIFIFKNLNELTYDCATVIQKYIPNPFLVSGYKFDLRLYVLVTSFSPLFIYIYHEGLVRFGTEKFDLAQTGNVFSHLTNTSINKYGPSYSCEKERVGSGCKWSLSQLRTYFHQHEIDDGLLWHRVSALIILTLLTQASEVPDGYPNCFELFGFDVLIDENLKPWLLEVNFSPSLVHDCPLDATIKKPMLDDIIDLLGFRKVDACKFVNSYPSKKPNKQSQLTARERSKAFQQKKTNLEKVSINDSDDNDSNPPESEAETDTEQCVDNSSSILDTTDMKLSINDRMKKSFPNDISNSIGIQDTDGDGCDFEKEYEIDSQNERPKTTPEPSRLSHTAAVQHNVCRSGKVSKSRQSAPQKPRRGITDVTQSSKRKSGHNHTGHSTRLGRTTHQSLKRISSSHTATSQSLKQRLSLPHSLKSSRARVKDPKTEIPADSQNGKTEVNSDLAMKILPRSYANAINSSNRFVKKPIAQAGNYILAFPFNEVTAKSSKHLIDTKTCVDEVKKALNKIRKTKSETSCTGSTFNLSEPFWGFKPVYNFGI